jgi:hypothetical protein
MPPSIVYRPVDLAAPRDPSQVSPNQQRRQTTPFVLLVRRAGASPTSRAGQRGEDVRGAVHATDDDEPLLVSGHVPHGRTGWVPRRAHGCRSARTVGSHPRHPTSHLVRSVCETPIIPGSSHAPNGQIRSRASCPVAPFLPSRCSSPAPALFSSLLVCCFLEVSPRWVQTEVCRTVDGMVDLVAGASDRRAAAGIFGRQDGRGSQRAHVRSRVILLVIGTIDRVDGTDSMFNSGCWVQYSPAVVCLF